jgi:hypothetical protein
VERWVLNREAALNAPGAMIGPKTTITLAKAIERFTKEYAGSGRSKNADLKRLRGMKIATRILVQVKPQHLIDHVRQRREDGAGPATAGNDLVWLRAGDAHP